MSMVRILQQPIRTAVNNPVTNTTSSSVLLITSSPYKYYFIFAMAGNVKAPFVSNEVSLPFNYFLSLTEQHAIAGKPAPNIRYNLQQSALMYTDKSWLYAAKNIVENDNTTKVSIIGADYIQTTGSDNRVLMSPASSQYQLSFTMDADAYVYVFVDKRWGTSKPLFASGKDVTITASQMPLNSFGTYTINPTSGYKVYRVAVQAGRQYTLGGLYDPAKFFYALLALPI
jgi:hypothetical protein